MPYVFRNQMSVYIQDRIAIKFNTRKNHSLISNKNPQRSHNRWLQTTKKQK